MGAWEITFFVLLILYHIGLLLERHRRPVLLNYLLLPAGIALGLTLGLETVHWKSLWLPDWDLVTFRWPLVPAAILWLAETIFLIFNLSNLRGMPPGLGFWPAFKGLLRTLGASLLLFAALGSAVLAGLFPYRLPAPTGSLPVAEAAFRFGNDRGSDWLVQAAVPVSKEPRQWYGLMIDPGPGDQPAWHRFLATNLASRGWVVVVLGKKAAAAPAPGLWPFNGRSVEAEFLEPVRGLETTGDAAWDEGWAETAGQVLANLKAGAVPGLEAVTDRVKTAKWGLISFGAEPPPTWLAAHPSLKAGILVRWNDKAKPANSEFLRYSWENVKRADLNDRALLSPTLVVAGLRSRWDAKPLESLSQFADSWFSWQLLGAEKALLNNLGPAFPGLQLQQGSQ